jgi:hypothetical protein
LHNAILPFTLPLGLCPPTKSSPSISFRYKLIKKGNHKIVDKNRFKKSLSTDAIKM